MRNPESVGTGEQWAKAYPHLGTGPVSTEGCISESFYQAEQERVFKRFWLNVGRVEEIPSAGDYFVKELAVWDSSIIVMRGKDGEVRAFHNICTHRCNKLIWNECGSCKNIVCNFHGWVFDSTGKNVSIPDEEDFNPGFKDDGVDLLPVSLEIWRGFIFVNYQAKPEQSLDEFLAEPGQGLADFPFEDLKECYVMRGEIKANWKVILDAFQEGYHLFLHRFSTARHAVLNDGTPFRALGYRFHHLHRQASFPYNPDRERLPVEKVAEAAWGETTVWANQEQKKLPDYVNITKDPKWAFDINVICPNMALFVTAGGWYWTHHFWPAGVGKTHWEFRQYYPRATTASQRFAQDYAWIQRRDVQSEDMSTTEHTQKALKSGHRRFFLFKDDEAMVRHAHYVIEREVAGAV